MICHDVKNIHILFKTLNFKKFKTSFVILMIKLHNTKHYLL